ncbi:MAG: 2-hydroxyacyl-CoA dehydratase family protein [Clostridia bacterium]
MTYLQEMEKFLEVMGDDLKMPSYFTDEFLDIGHENEKSKKVGIIGDSFYSLYVRAYGLTPVLLPSGSYISGEYAEMFPQISDPIAKASIGLLLDPENNFKEELDAVIIVAKNDSYKKSIAYLRDMNLAVIQVEPLPFLHEKLSFSFYKQQAMVLNDISKLVFGIFNEATFNKELKEYTRAYEIMEEDSFKTLSTMHQTFFKHVLHVANNKSDWCDELEEFLEDIEVKTFLPKVTLMGSSMHLPNYKVFQIFNDIGITHFNNECSDFPNFSEIDTNGGGLFKKALAFHHKETFNSATVSNIDRMELPTDTGGIVYYLLKGQTSSAYHAERIEELAIEQGVPFICVETDYTYTDSEQMKIRIEAFYEMLKSSSKQKA